MRNGDRRNAAFERTDAYKGIAVTLVLLTIIGWMLVERGQVSRAAPNHKRPGGSTTPGEKELRSTVSEPRWRQRFGATPSQTAEQIVSARVADFGRKRLEWVRAKSLREGKDVPPEVEEFFKAMQRGDWTAIDESFSSLAKRSAQYEGSTHWPALDPFWPAVLEAYGAAEQAHLWPADKLLEYGDAILGSLRPGMVYVGGTDPGRFVPTLLNETSEGEPHVVLTQNALADSRYLEYIRSLHSDQLTLPTDDDSKRIFEEYIADAQKRLEHDEQFPDEPKQLKTGENVQMIDGKVAVSGQIAVMTINEKLLQWTLERNPEAEFAVEESFPFRTTYKTAAPLGPIMELRAKEPFAETRAQQTLDYWRDMSQRLQESPPSEGAADLKTYSHMAVSQANLLASHNYASEAEATYKLAFEIFPRSTDAALNFAQFLSESGRPDEAKKILTDFRINNPDLSKDMRLEVNDN